MIYILIFGTWSAAQGQAPATAEFNNESACKFAITELQKQKRADVMFAFCVPKGKLND